MIIKPQFRLSIVLAVSLWLAGCVVGPDFVPPQTPTPDNWSQTLTEGLSEQGLEQFRWWLFFEDPTLNELIELAWDHNPSLEIAALRVLESRARLGVATGAQFPQTQLVAGDATYQSPPAHGGSRNRFWSYGLGATASWELDFWGRYQRGIESADAAFLADVSAYDQAHILLTQAVVVTYTTIRSLEEQLRIARENVTLQERSMTIAQVNFENGADSELDVQQARTLLLSTQSTIPALETGLIQARNAMSTLLGQLPGGMDELLDNNEGLPAIPETLSIGLPADMLRQRPDVRRAELQAMAANAQVGLAQADLYPSFFLTGSIGVAAGGAGNSDFGDLFHSDALTWSVGPSLVWPFLNYGRIKNNVRVQDAVLQQALVNYRDVALRAAGEAENAMAAFVGARRQQALLQQTVDSALRSNELSSLRYREGFSDYERVLDAQQALFNQQTRLVSAQTDVVLSLADLYTALGGAWQVRESLPAPSPETIEVMRQRTDWGEILDEIEVPEEPNDTTP